MLDIIINKITFNYATLYANSKEYDNILESITVDYIAKSELNTLSGVAEFKDDFNLTIEGFKKVIKEELIESFGGKHE